MATYSKAVSDILENKAKLKKAEVLFALISTGEFKTSAEAEKALSEANVIKRGKGGREAFYDYLRNGGKVESVKDLVALIDSGEIPFSDNEKAKANYGHWLAIAELVNDVRGE